MAFGRIESARLLVNRMALPEPPEHALACPKSQPRKGVRGRDMESHYPVRRSSGRLTTAPFCRTMTLSCLANGPQICMPVHMVWLYWCASHLDSVEKAERR